MIDVLLHIGVVVGGMVCGLLIAAALVQRITPAELVRRVRREFGSTTPRTRIEVPAWRHVRGRPTDTTARPTNWTATWDEFRQRGERRMDDDQRTTAMLAEQDRRYEQWKREQRARIEEPEALDIPADTLDRIIQVEDLAGGLTADFHEVELPDAPDPPDLGDIEAQTRRLNDLMDDAYDRQRPRR